MCRSRWTVACAVPLLTVLLAIFQGCKEASQAEQVPRSTPEVVSPQEQAYEKAVNDYNDFIAHPQGHHWNVVPHDRRIELCYLAVQVVATSVRVPALAADTNSDGEIKEWRRWIDIRHSELRCDDVK